MSLIVQISQHIAWPQGSLRMVRGRLMQTLPALLGPLLSFATDMEAVLPKPRGEEGEDQGKRKQGRRG